MIVQRLMFPTKIGRGAEAAELAREERARTGSTHRIYRSYLGPADTLAMEFESEGLGEMEAFWSEWFATPESGTFMAKWNELTKGGGSNEVWTLIE